MSDATTTAPAADPTAKRSVRDLVRAAISGWLERCADRPSIAAEIETVSALA